jgi:nitrite reductase (cytochrome c-552)
MTQTPVPGPSAPGSSPAASRRRVPWLYLLTIVGVAAATIAVMFLLDNIGRRKREGEQVVFSLVNITESTIDPAEWGKNFPRQYDGYRRTAERSGTKYGGGGSETLATDKLQQDPRLVTLFAGYAFSVDYRARRGHAFMLSDQDMTKRVQDPFKQPGSCVHCHASIIPAYRAKGKELGAPDAPEDRFQWAQVMKGFEAVSAMPYAEARKLVNHPVACLDCHDPRSMQLRVTRPGFVRGIQALAAGDAPVPHLASIEKWRRGPRTLPYDPNADASRQEMRSFVCGQCHVTYYCGPKATLFFPWNNGLRVEQIESYYDGYKFADGHRFYDWKHKATGAELLKSKHPEFETWSQGIHARSGVACADCHMPYLREGAIKISDHQVRSPLLNIARSCQVCHRYPEEEIKARVETIQDRTHALLSRAEDATVDLIHGLEKAQAGGASDDQLKAARQLQRQAQWRVDFVNAENSMGFHAPQEAARILGEAIDFARQGEIDLLRNAKPLAAAP